MVALNTLLIVSILAFGAGVLTLGVMGLLIAIYRNTKKNDDNESGIYTIPASSLMGGPPMGGGGGGMNGLMQLYAAAQAAKESEEAGKKDTPKADIGGQYI